MDQAIEIIGDIVQKAPAYIAALVAVLSALIGLFMLIPGDQPEKALKKILAVLTKFSRK